MEDKIEACLSAMLCPRDRSGQDLQLSQVSKHLQSLTVLVEFTPPILHFFSRHALTRKFIKLLMRIIHLERPPSSVLSKSLFVLTHLAFEDSMKERIIQDANFMPLLFERLVGAKESPFFIKYLQLVKNLSVGLKSIDPGDALFAALNTIISLVRSQDETIMTNCLAVLSNLTRCDVVVNHIKGMEAVNSLYKFLIELLSHQNLSIIVFSLGVLAHMSLKDSLGAKLFSATNVEQTFQLVFSLITSGESVELLRFSCELLIDLFQYENIRWSLERYPQLSESIMMMTSYISTDSFAIVNPILRTFRRISSSPTIEAILWESIIESGALDGLILWASNQHIPTAVAASELLMKIMESSADVRVRVLNHPGIQALIDGHMHALNQGPGDSDVEEQRFIAIVTLLDLLIQEQAIKSRCVYLVQLNECIAWMYSSVSKGKSHAPLLTCALLTQFCSDLAMAASQPKVMQFVSRDEILRSIAAIISQPESPLLLSAALRLVGHVSTHLPSSKLVDIVQNVFASKPVESVAPATDDMECDEKRETRTRLQDAEEEIRRLRERLSREKEIRESRTIETSESFQSQVVALQTQISHLQDLLDVKSAAMQQLDRRVEESRTKRAHAEAKISALESQFQECIKSHEDLQRQYLSTKETLVEMEGQKKEMKQQYENIIRVCAAHEENITNLKGQIQHLEQSNQVLQSRAAEVENLQIELGKRNQRLLQISAEYDDLQKAFEAKQQELMQKHADACATIKTLEFDLAKLTKEVDKRDEALGKLASVTSLIHSLSANVTQELNTSSASKEQRKATAW